MTCATSTRFIKKPKIQVPAIFRKLHVANKAVIVLVAAMWEAYCEDMADESLALLVRYAPGWQNLPQPLLKAVTKELRNLNEDLAPWMLAGDGWRQYLMDRQPILAQKRNYSFATPKAKQVDSLFLESAGIVRISDNWRLPQGPEWARQELDRYIDMRNAIAHRYAPGSFVTKKDVRAFYNLVAFLVAQTDAAVGSLIEQVTGQNRWAEVANPRVAI